MAAVLNVRKSLCLILHCVCFTYSLCIIYWCYRRFMLCLSSLLLPNDLKVKGTKYLPH